MLRTQIIALVIAISMVIFLYTLPKVVINETDKAKLAIKSEPHQLNISMDNMGEQVMPQNMITEIINLRNSYYKTLDVKKRIIFADSIANLFALYGKPDSAKKYADEIVLLNNSKRSLQIAGDIYFKIYSSTENPTDANSYASKAQELYKEILKEDPGNSEVKNNLAMTYVTSANPMQAISLLREILTKDPLNETALFNIGFLSIKSGQYEKAIERFKKLIELNQRNWKAHLYLGLALREVNHEEEALEEFTMVLKNTKDAKLKAEAQNNLGVQN